MPPAIEGRSTQGKRPELGCSKWYLFRRGALSQDGLLSNRPAVGDRTSKEVPPKGWRANSSIVMTGKKCLGKMQLHSALSVSPKAKGGEGKGGGGAPPQPSRK